MQTAVILIGTLGWWGFVYPELSAVTENYVQESSDEETNGDACNEEGERSEVKDGETVGTASGEESASFAARLIKDLGNTGIKSGNVRIKSRIMEYLYQRKEKETTEKESGYDRQECAHWGV